jgi:glucose/arabinose dehydrogenase
MRRTPPGRHWPWVPGNAQGLAIHPETGELWANEGQRLVRLRIEQGRVVDEERLVRGMGRIRDVRQGPDGYTTSTS